MELNNIYNEDCITYMKTLPEECVDLIIADPHSFINIFQQKTRIL